MSRKMQYKTYGAEEAIQSAYIYPDYREYVDSVCAELGLPKITVKDGRRCRRALYYKQSRCIVLPKWSRTRKTMLHEIAHYMEDFIFGKTGHGRNFQVIYEGLISVFMGEDALLDYQKAMKKSKGEIEELYW